MKRHRGEPHGRPEGKDSRHHSHYPHSSHSSHPSHPSHSQAHASHKDKRPRPNQAHSTELKLDWKKQQSQLICDMRYSNTLPWPPLDPKLLHIALSQDRLTRHCSSSLQRALKAPILCERNLGIPIDMIDQEEYRPAPGQVRPMDPSDAALFFKDQFERAASGLEVRIKSRGGHLQDRHLSWLEKPMHLQNNLYDNWEKKRDFEFQKEQRLANNIDKAKENLTREDQMAIIENTFDFARQTPVHPLNPNIKAVKSLEIFPHQSLGHEGFTWISFDSAPAELLKDANADASEAKLIHASFLRSYTGSHHTLYFPDPSNPPSGTKRHFKWLREYFKNPTPTVNDLNNFYFTIDGDAVVYNRFQHRLSLRIRTQTANDPHADEEIVSRPRFATVDTDNPPALSEKDELFGIESGDEDDVFGDATVAQTVEETAPTDPVEDSNQQEESKHDGLDEETAPDAGEQTLTKEEQTKLEGEDEDTIAKEEDDEDVTKMEAAEEVEDVGEEVREEEAYEGETQEEPHQDGTTQQEEAQQQVEEAQEEMQAEGQSLEETPAEESLGQDSAEEQGAHVDGDEQSVEAAFEEPDVPNQ